MVCGNDSYFIFIIAITSEQNPSYFVSIPKVAIVENHRLRLRMHHGVLRVYHPMRLAMRCGWR
jgi:hypothetical protein